MKKDPVELGGFWLPKSSSTLAPEIDMAWDMAMWLSVVFFVGIVGAMMWFCWKYKRRSLNDLTSKIDHNTTLEITWTVVPSILCVVTFLVGFKGYITASVAPAEAFEVHVTAEKWRWDFHYPNGSVSPSELRVPKGRPVKLIMSAKDVLHSFYVPEFRVKADVVPGMYTTLWFEATDLGEKQVFCTEYCGTGHSDMLAKVIVMEPKDAGFGRLAMFRDPEGNVVEAVTLAGSWFEHLRELRKRRGPIPSL
jgi:cytochrome c oxidase subunit 2